MPKPKRYIPRLTRAQRIRQIRSWRGPLHVERSRPVPAPSPPMCARDIFLGPGLILVMGIEARAFAQRLYRALTPNLKTTVALIEPCAVMSLAEVRAVVDRADGAAIVVASPVWSQVKLWDLEQHAHVIVHAASGVGFITKGAPDRTDCRILDAATLTPLSPNRNCIS